MLQARALFYAIFISLFIAVLCMSLISVTQLYQLQQVDQFQKEKLIRNVKSGMSIINSLEDIPYFYQELDLYEQGTDSVKILKRDWGVFDIGSIEAYGKSSYGRDTLIRTALFGTKKNPTLKSAIYLADKNLPLAIAGKTEVKGSIYIPKAGIKPIKLPNISPTIKNAIEGERSTSSAFLPPINSKRINNLLEYILPGNNSSIKLDDQQKKYQAYTDSTIYIQGETVILGDVELGGNIVIQANKKIIIESNAVLQDLLLFAPEIKVMDNFSGTFQAYATQKINIGPNVHLDYPTILGLIKTKQSEKSPSIIIEENVELGGMVFIVKEHFDRYHPRLIIKEGTIIEGQIYVQGTVEMKGQLNGQISCEKFMYHSGGASYDNLLVDAIIDRHQLSDHFVSPFVTAYNTENSIVKWIE